jgi:signal transduction histidine kinase
MRNFFKEGFLFIRKNPEILFSLLLIFVIPLALYYNLFFTIKSFQKNVNYELQTRALLVESILSVLAKNYISNPEILQKTLEDFVKENPDISQEISQLQIISYQEDGKFQILASTDSQEVGQEIREKEKKDRLAIAWGKNENITQLVKKGEERFWDMINIFHDQEGKKIGLISLSLSLKQWDDLIFKTVSKSYLILFISIFITLLLVIEHTRLFQYPMLYQKLREIDKMKDEFIRMAIHELQSPVSNIRGYIESLKEDLYPTLNEEQREDFSRISISAKNLSDLISDMLEVSRIEQGRLDFTPQKISPPKIISEIIKEFEIKAETKGLKLIFEEKEEPCFVKVNPVRLKQILVNLIENAIKYTKMGEVEIQTNFSLTKKKYFISVRDTGVGISAENQKHLFEKFYRVKTRETAGIPGTGLGLWITREICQKMGGEILLESLEGVGSKFTIYFPLVEIK